MILSCHSVVCSSVVGRGLLAALPALTQVARCATYRQTRWPAAAHIADPSPLSLVYESGFSAPVSEVSTSDEQQQNRELLRYRTEFPDSMWHHIAGLLRSRPFPTAVDMGFAALGAQGLELQQLGFRVIEAVPPGPGDNPATYPRLPAECSDIVTCLPGPTTPHAAEALAEARRLMCKGGFLAVAWNDRDLSSSFVSELESLLETINPDYCRSSKQHNPPAWTNALTDGNSLKLVSFTCHPHRLVMARCGALQDLLGGLACVRAHLAASSATRKFFHREVRALVERHFDPSEPFQLPLITKLYVLRKHTAAAALHMDQAAATERQQAATMCTAAGSECGVGIVMSDDESEPVMQPVVRTRRHGCSLHF